MYPLVKFVEAPEPAAAVRYDCNRAGEEGVAARRVMAEGFSLGSPTIEGDPDAVGVTYGFRQPVFTQRVKGTKQEALAALSSLSRELLRQTNWLLVQVDAFTAPVWLKIYRSGFAPLSLSEVYVNTRSGDPVLVPDAWDIQVPLVADAFAYGERETLDPVTVVQNSTGGNPMGVVLPAIKGDAPTALRLELTVADSLQGEDQIWLLGGLSGSADMSGPVVEIGTGDGMTAGTGTGAPSSDAAFFGGSYRAVTISAATPNLLNRLTGALPAVPPGRYKVALRCEADASAGASKTYLFQLATGSTDQAAPAVQITANARLAGPTPDLFRGWVDLGDFSLPANLSLPPSLPITAISPTTFMELRIGTADGSAGTVRIDALKLIPLDGQTIDSASLLVTQIQDEALSPSLPGTWDGDYEAIWGIHDTLGWVALKPSSRGQFPIVDPISTHNEVVVMCMSHGNFGSGASVASTGAEADLVVSYHPRLLHLGDGT